MPTQRTPESGVPLLEQLKRMLPAMLGGPQGDVRLPMAPDGARDPRLPAPNQFDMIQEGMDRVRGLAGGQDAASAAMQAMKRQR